MGSSLTLTMHTTVWKMFIDQSVVRTHPGTFRSWNLVWSTFTLEIFRSQTLYQTWKKKKFPHRESNPPRNISVLEFSLDVYSRNISVADFISNLKKKNLHSEISGKGQISKVKVKKQVPTPGIEPGPPAWKAGILTTRPYGRTDWFSVK